MCRRGNSIVFIALFAAIGPWCSSARGMVTIRETGTWPADWPAPLESFRAQAKTFGIATGIQENVYEIRFSGRLEIANYRKAVQQDNLVLAADAARPAGAKSIPLPNKYDPGRIYLAVYNWDKTEAVDVKIGGLVRDGDRVELLDPKALFGDPVARATCRDDVIRIPVQGEFAVFVLRVSRR